MSYGAGVRLVEEPKTRNSNRFKTSGLKHNDKQIPDLPPVEGSCSEKGRGPFSLCNVRGTSEQWNDGMRGHRNDLESGSLNKRDCLDFIRLRRNSLSRYTAGPQGASLSFFRSPNS